MASVVDLIKKDHRAIEDMFEEYKNSDNNNDDLALKICAELKKHAQAEEAEVYKFLPGEIRGHSLEEHQEINNAIAIVESGEGSMKDNMASLEHAVKHHVEEEEAMALTSLEYSTLDLHAIGEAFEQAKA